MLCVNEEQMMTANRNLTTAILTAGEAIEGDMIVRSNNRPEVAQDVEVMLCWLHNAPSKPRTKYTVKHTSNDQKAMIKEVVYIIDINTLERVSGDAALEMNAIAKVKIRTTKPLFLSCRLQKTSHFLFVFPSTLSCRRQETSRNNIFFSLACHFDDRRNPI